MSTGGLSSRSQERRVRGRRIVGQPAPQQLVVLLAVPVPVRSPQPALQGDPGFGPPPARGGVLPRGEDPDGVAGGGGEPPGADRDDRRYRDATAARGRNRPVADL